MKKILLFGFLCVALMGCFENSSCNQVKLLQKEKEWSKFYSLDDTLVFGNREHEKEFIVKDIGTSFTPCMKFELGPNIYEYSGILLKSNTFEININFTRENQDSKEVNCIKQIYVSDLYTHGLTDLEFLKKEDVFIPYLNKIESTYLITSDTLTVDVDGGNQMVKSFNWSKKYGVVRYTRYNDEVFTLLKKK